MALAWKFGPTHYQNQSCPVLEARPWALKPYQPWPETEAGWPCCPFHTWHRGLGPASGGYDWQSGAALSSLDLT